MTLRPARHATWVASALLCLTACHAPGERPVPKGAVQPTTTHPPAAGVHYVIDGQQSQVLILVYRDGAMARLGHNHVIAVRQLTGSVTLGPDPTQGSFQLDFPAEALSVDEPALRAAEGPDFQTTVDEAAIAGTRDHMLGEALLSSKQYPQIHLQSEQIHADGGGLTALTSIVVRATTAHVEIPISLTTGGDVVKASGEFDLTHSQLGLTPYSVALGALKVAERIHIRYQLTAHRG